MTIPYYSDESVTLYHGDCREITDWLHADVLVTDPPYGVDWHSGQMDSGKAPRVQNVAGDTDASLRDDVLTMWESRPAIVFGSWRVARPPRVRHLLIWHKANRKPGFTTSPWYPSHEEVYVLGDGFGGHPTGTVMTTREHRDGASGHVARSGHPTPKPVGLMEQLLTKCPPGVVADPFAGSGSTLLAAAANGRRAIGVEIEERYCEAIARRLDQGVLTFEGVPS